MSRVGRRAGGSLVGALATLAALGCGGGGAEGGTGGGDTSGGEVPAQYQGPVAGDAAAGATAFDGACARCHDDPSQLRDLGWEPGRMRRQVREGSGRMPPLPESRLSAADLEDLLAHLQEMGAVR